jgi:hypothetical protein
MDDSAFFAMQDVWTSLAHSTRIAEKNHYLASGFLFELRRRRKEWDAKIVKMPPDFVDESFWDYAALEYAAYQRRGVYRC